MNVEGNTDSTAMGCFGTKASYQALESQSRGKTFTVFSEFSGTHM